MATVFVTTGVLGSSLAHSLTPISDGAAVFMGKGGRLALSIAAILAFVSTANAGIMASSRYPLALSRDGLMPEVLMKINRRFKTPHVAILITGVFMVLALMLQLSMLVKVASTVLILTFFISVALVISGIFVYWTYGRIRTNREYALLHLIERITAKELTSRTLETELKEIIRERDDILEDRFDIHHFLNNALSNALR
ncbi:MAG: amino acid permease [Candidatus Omnitrophica bacterium]|nr:amino acid permease [Candidatus Omnitrophota bacterium]MBU4478733.1 amino acid permease [Candidatus Omnitrophota bacterium]MCG2703194.1 amino acid permease [Candidatus Omnitrophota bacterium]